MRDGRGDAIGEHALRFRKYAMTALTQSRRIVFFDAEGTPFQPVRHGDRATGQSVFKIKPKGASNRANEARQTEDILEVARAMLVDGLAVRCRALAGGDVNYLRYGAEKLLRYEIGAEIAQALGIPANGSVGDMAVVVSRQAVEAAMDAFDRYRLDGEDEDVFSRFGDPRDFWVRSTRERQNRVYPTKPLVGYILKKTGVNGGWGQKSDAAARLHNAGFIIVEQDGNPVTPPEHYSHLMSGADRIRSCALNYFIEPAREGGASQVSIRAGDLAAAMGLKDAIPICQTLVHEKFQQLAEVPPPTHTEPNPSSSTIFTYKLSSQAEGATVTEATKTPMRSVTNLILYGTPGTGKTYRTAWEAVLLCLGEQVAATFKGDEKRDALMAEYRRLVTEGRIEFVTFHQSMSYEEFVEGLRPSTSNDSDKELDGVEINTGFHLKPHDGVFKRISDRARLACFNAAAGGPIDLTRSVYKMSLGDTTIAEGDLIFDECIRGEKILMGFNLGINWSDDIYADIDEILRRTRQVPGHEDVSRNSGFVSFQDILRNELEVGSIVLVSRGLKKLRAIGVVTGGYFFDAKRVDNYKHGRPVKWLWTSEKPDTDVDVSSFYSKDFSRQTLYSLRKQIDWPALLPLVRERGVFNSSDRQQLNHVLIIDEINRANISKVFGELITLLEPDKRLGMPNEIRLVLPYSKRPFGVPANLHIIGTMNTADRSIALLDSALRRRFTFREMMPDPLILSKNVGGIDLQKLLTTINDRIEYLFDREHQVGHAYFTGCTTRDDVEVVMRQKIIPLLAEYFYEDWSKVAAVLGDTGQGQARFLEARRLAAPPGIADDDFADERLRWSVKAEFDFSEFAA
jgi:5-methylcytosine-specific restriction protein B